jgi:murein DD-endopeptidase MepM/ murein hydrolase activator NlpD
MRDLYNNWGISILRNLLQRIDRDSSPAHIGSLRNVVDFIAPLNTLVLAAAADGEVVFVNDDSNIGGPNPSYRIQPTLLQYYIQMRGILDMTHLEYHRGIVKVGQQHVNAGQRDILHGHDWLYLYSSFAFPSIFIYRI